MARCSRTSPTLRQGKDGTRWKAAQSGALQELPARALPESCPLARTPAALPDHGESVAPMQQPASRLLTHDTKGVHVAGLLQLVEQEGLGGGVGNGAQRAGRAAGAVGTA